MKLHVPGGPPIPPQTPYFRVTLTATVSIPAPNEAMANAMLMASFSLAGQLLAATAEPLKLETHAEPLLARPTPHGLGS